MNFISTFFSFVKRHLIVSVLFLVVFYYVFSYFYLDFRKEQLKNEWIRVESKEFSKDDFDIKNIEDELLVRHRGVILQYVKAFKVGHEIYFITLKRDWNYGSIGYMLFWPIDGLVHFSEKEKVFDSKSDVLKKDFMIVGPRKVKNGVENEDVPELYKKYIKETDYIEDQPAPSVTLGLDKKRLDSITDKVVFVKRVLRRGEKDLYGDFGVDDDGVVLYKQLGEYIFSPYLRASSRIGSLDVRGYFIYLSVFGERFVYDTNRHKVFELEKFLKIDQVKVKSYGRDDCFIYYIEDVAKNPIEKKFFSLNVCELIFDKQLVWRSAKLTNKTQKEEIQSAVKKIASVLEKNN